MYICIYLTVLHIRINTPTVAEQMLRDGHADMVRPPKLIFPTRTAIWHI